MWWCGLCSALVACVLCVLWIVSVVGVVGERWVVRVVCVVRAYLCVCYTKN